MTITWLLIVLVLLPVSQIYKIKFPVEGIFSPESFKLTTWAADLKKVDITINMKATNVQIIYKILARTKT